MKPELWIRCALEPALSLLPPTMDTPPARAMSLAICLQESALEYRRQIGGPARGYGQFEIGGVRGVLRHPATKPHIERVLEALDYHGEASDTHGCHEAIEHNDVLMAAFIRLNLYWLPNLLPVRGDPEGGWLQYIEAWRPGKPHRKPWNENFANAWEAVS